MADYFEPKLLSTEGEGPSPVFVADMRKTLLAESSKPVLVVDDDDVINIDLRQDEREDEVTKKRWILLGATAVAVVIAGFVGFGGGSKSDEVETISDVEDSAPATTTISVETITNTEEALAPSTSAETVPQGPASFVADAPLFADEFSPIEAGTYRVDSLGTPFSFTIDEPLSVSPNGLAHFVLGRPLNGRPDDRAIEMVRFSELWDPVKPNTSREELEDAWPADDFDGWLENLSDGIVVTNRSDTELGGLAAIRIDLEVESSECKGSDFCVGFTRNEQFNATTLNGSSKYRIWIVEQEGQSPLAVIVGIINEDHIDWFETAEGILATFVFGDVAPNPVLRLPFGPVELPFLDGIQIEIDSDVKAIEVASNSGWILPYDQSGESAFLFDFLDLDGNALERVDRVSEILSESGSEIAELEPTTIAGLEARVFGVSGQASGAILKLDPDDERGWQPPPLGQIWLVEHPERGLLMVTAEAYDGSETTFVLVAERVEAILASLEFIDLE